MAGCHGIFWAWPESRGDSSCGHFLVSFRGSNTGSLGGTFCDVFRRKQPRLSSQRDSRRGASSILSPQTTLDFSNTRKRTVHSFSTVGNVQSTALTPASLGGTQHRCGSHLLFSQPFQWPQETQNRPMTISSVNPVVDHLPLEFHIYHNFESQWKFLTSCHSHPKILFVVFE